MMADLRKTTMGHITIDHLEQSQIAIPNDEVAAAFEVITKPIIDRMVKSHEENQELTQLRLAAADADEWAGDGGDYQSLNFQTWNYGQRNHAL